MRKNEAMIATIANLLVDLNLEPLPCVYVLASDASRNGTADLAGCQQVVFGDGARHGSLARRRPTRGQHRRGEHE